LGATDIDVGRVGQNRAVLLQEVVTTSALVAGSPGRKAKTQAIAELLSRVPPAEVPVAVAFLSGDLTQRQIGVGYAALMDLTQPAVATSTAPTPAAPTPAGSTAGTTPAAPTESASMPGQAEPAAKPAAEPVLTLSETDAAFAAIGAQLGPGSQAQRRAMLGSLIDRATAPERQFLFRLIAGDLGQGALEGVMVDAVAQAAGAPAAEVRRANQLRGSLPEVARAALAAKAGGADQQAVVALLRSFTLQVGQPVRPMLAASAPTVDAALTKISPAALDWKIDGIRIQIHRRDQQVQVFTRTLDDITDRVPEIVTMALGLDVSSVVIDGEAIALREDQRPYPFQVTSARVASQAATGTSEPAGRTAVPLTAFLFDLLHIDGADLIDCPADERFARLTAIAPADLLIPRLVTADAGQATGFFADAIGHGHEGVVVKSVDAPYQSGRRGSDWIKVKPRTTLDLVILAAEWGHGRRTGLLSNLHLGARDPQTGTFVMLGKTFKGLTDAMLRWQTDELLSLADPPGQRSVPVTWPPDAAADQAAGSPTAGSGVVRVRPELVAEIAFDGVQASRRYPGGVALRFARVLRYRTDKRADEADTIDMVRALWPE
jgi:ATP-dependent DNA ligase I